MSPSVSEVWATSNEPQFSMTFFERALLAIAGGVLGLWTLVKAFLGWVWGGLDAVLNPILSTLLRWLNPLCTAIADGVYRILSPLPPWVGLVLISAIAGVVMLIAFRYLSNQVGISRAKDDIKANLLALKLFKDDLRVALRAQVRIMWALLRLQRYILVPVLWMALPTMLLLSQMAMRYQWRPFAPGEPILLKVHADTPQLGGTSTYRDLGHTKLIVPTGVEIEVGPLADPDDTAWRLRATQPGRHQLTIQTDPEIGSKEVVVGLPGQRVSPVRPGPRWIEQLLYPIEPVIDADSGFSSYSVDVAYPELKSRIYGSDYWVLTFFIVSMLTAILLKPLFNVRF